jgi:dTMP kinase
MLIAVEGIDGAGKSTLVGRLKIRLGELGHRITCARRYMVPEITELWWKLVAADALDQDGGALLAAADYRLGVAGRLRPALAAGEVVIADKYYYSHVVYFHLRGLGLERLRSLFPDVLVPDLVLHLRLPVEVALERLVTQAGKPDLLESGLDHRLGLSLGKAYGLYGLGGAPAGLRFSHFIEHQTLAAALYDRLLPPARTRIVDGTLDRESVVEECLRHLGAVRERGPTPAAASAPRGAMEPEA